MHERFLKLSFLALLAVLWCIFSACTGLTYWTPMRTLPLSVPFTISPLEWTAFWSYITFLAFAVVSQLATRSRSHARIWVVALISAVIFTTTALALEYYLFFNARDPEKSDTAALIIGCIGLALFVAVCGSLVLVVIRRVSPHAPNQAMQRTASRSAF